MPSEEMRSRAMPQAPDVATGIVVAAVAGFLAFVAITMIGLFFYLRVAAPGALRQATESHFPAPALQKNPRNNLKRVEREQRMALSSYGWIDRSKGLVRIPIDEAMRMIVARGDRAYAPDPSAVSSNTGNPSGARP